MIASRGEEEVGIGWEHVSVDVLDFEGAVSSGDAEQALALYEGELMDGFFVSGCPDFDHWLDGERRRLCQDLWACVSGATGVAEGRGDLRVAVGLAEAAAKLRPLHEASTRVLMRLYARVGERTAALGAFDDLARRLDTDLEVEPEAETLALADALRDSHGDAVGDSLPVTDHVRTNEGTDRSTDPARGGRRIGWKAPTMAGALMSVTAIVVAAVGATGEDRSAEVNGHPPRIALLPFENRSSLEEDAYFTDGVHDELLTRLQRIEGLDVISRTTVEAYRETEMTVPGIGRELGVGYVLEGAVQRAGAQVHITVRLVDASTDRQVWGETYRRALTKPALFEVQSEIVQTVANEMHVTLLEDERARANRRGTGDMRAYELFLRARSMSHREAIPLLEEAVKRDPDFLAAHARLARAHAELWQFYERTPARQTAALAAADRALELDSTSVDARLAMGVYLYRMKEWEQALDWFDRAGRTLAGDVDYHKYKGWAARRLANWPDALTLLATAARMDPLSGITQDQHGMTFFLLHRFDEAAAALTGGTRPGFRAISQWHVDDDMDALSDAAAALGGFIEWELAMYSGEWDRALEVLAELPDVHDHDGTMRQARPLLRAWAHQGAGGDAEAHEYFEKALSAIQSQILKAPHDARLHAALGLAYAGLGSDTEAVDAALRAVDMIPDGGDAVEGPQYLYQLAGVYAQLGRSDEAVSVLEELLSAPGWQTSRLLEVEFLMRPLRGHPGFQAVLDKHRGQVF